MIVGFRKLFLTIMRLVAFSDETAKFITYVESLHFYLKRCAFVITLRK